MKEKDPNDPILAIREYDKGADAWFAKVKELTGMDFFMLEDRHLDPYGAYDSGMSAEDFAKEALGE